jgi:hypothetical protein
LRNEHIDDRVNVLGAEAVLGAILQEAPARIDHKDALAGVGVLFVDGNDAGRDACAVEEVGGQANNALDVTLADKCTPDIGLGAAAEQDAVRQDAGAFAYALERAHDVQKIGVVALLLGRVPKVWNRPKGSCSGSRPVLQLLSEKGGLATT